MFLDEFADSVPTCRPSRASRASGGAAVRTDLHRLLGRPSRSSAARALLACESTSKLLTKLSATAAPSPRISSSRRATSPTTTVRRLRLPLPPRRAIRSGVRGRDGRSVEASRGCSAACPSGRWNSCRRRRTVAGRAPARDPRRRPSTSSACSPAASLSHVGVYASGRTLQQLVLHLLAQPLAEARAYGAMMLGGFRRVIHSSRACRARDPGGRWIEYLQTHGETAAAAAVRLGLGEETEAQASPSVRLLRAHGSEQTRAASLRCCKASTIERGRHTACGEKHCLRTALVVATAPISSASRRTTGTAGRDFETLSYRFRDHLRLRRVPGSPAAPPAHLPVAAAVAVARRRRPARGRTPASARGEQALDVSRAEYEHPARRRAHEEAPYALCLAYGSATCSGCDTRWACT